MVICSGLLGIVTLIILGICIQSKRSRPRNPWKGVIRRVTNADTRSSLYLFENHSVDELLQAIESRFSGINGLRQVKSLYGTPPTFPDLGNFRLGPNMFLKIPLDWLVLVSDDKKSDLIGHGVTARIAWNGTAETLPEGWQGAVRQCYQDAVASPRCSNTLVGLFIYVEPDHRHHQWAARIADFMKHLARRRGLEHFVIPLRPPLRYTHDYAEMPFEEFAALKRPDGLPLDHWVRLHVKMGASVIRIANRSHRHAMSLADYLEQFGGPPVETSGERLVERNEEWFTAYLDRDHDIAIIDQGCVWVRHDLDRS